MKITTVCRLVGKDFGWYVNTKCDRPGHMTNGNCNCEVPRNWVFAFDVHRTYDTLVRLNGMYGYP